MDEKPVLIFSNKMIEILELLSNKVNHRRLEFLLFYIIKQNILIFRKYHRIKENVTRTI